MTLEEKIDYYFDNASTDEVVALLEECGIERYKNTISVSEYLKATEHLVTDRPGTSIAPSVSKTVESQLQSASKRLRSRTIFWAEDTDSFPTFHPLSKRTYLLKTQPTG